MNLDGFALPVKKLQGTDPVETLDLSGKNLGVASAVVIASLICVNGGLTSLDLSNNALCGRTSNGGTYTADGITAIADTLRINGGLTSINLSGNQLCGIWTDWRGQHGTYTAEGITAIADALRVNGALTECSLQYNPCIGEEGEALIRKAVQGKAGFKLRI